MARDNRIRYKKDPSWETKLRLASMLSLVRRTDGIDYDVRNRALYSALAIANNIGIRAGIRIDPEEPAWPVVFFDLPTGQVSWHVPQYEGVWDNHTTDEKNTRTDDFIRATYQREHK